MKNLELRKSGDKMVRVLESKEDKALIVDCIRITMPKWVKIQEIQDYDECSESELLIHTGKMLVEEQELDSNSRKIAHHRYSMIAGILPYVGDKAKRSQKIQEYAVLNNICRKTIANYLWVFLVYQDIFFLAPANQKKEKELSRDEKNMRWALNRFFYNKNKNSIHSAYTMMLKERYCDGNGILLDKYPTIYQFRYFYKKTKKLQTYYISRNGIKDYQRNNRPLLGDGIQAYAESVGMGMLDATVCDIYLINHQGELIGRPVLVLCIDAYSSMCCGYSLLWEGGMFSLRNLMMNIVADKVEWCRKRGILIKREEWDSDEMPGVFITDMGSEYKSETFGQITELGIMIENLPPYRPELKGAVEKAFDLIQNEYKKHLKGRGVIEADFRERGAHDYRKDACLTMDEFEKVILRCILFYNSGRVIENFPYTEEMLRNDIQPNAASIFEWGRKRQGSNLIRITKEDIFYTLLPRTEGRFSRNGLKVNRMRYSSEGYTEEYLKGDSVTVAYNPEDVSRVWLLKDGRYIPYELIESRFRGKTVDEVGEFQEKQKILVKRANENKIQAQIDLANHLQTIAQNSVKREKVRTKGLRDNREKEKQRLRGELKIGENVYE